MTEPADATGGPDFPPVVYIPTVQGDDGEMHVDMRITRDGRTALLVYSAPDRLEKWFGSRSWVLAAGDDLEKLHRDTPFDLLFLDKSIVPDAEEESQ